LNVRQQALIKHRVPHLLGLVHCKICWVESLHVDPATYIVEFLILQPNYDIMKNKLHQTRCLPEHEAPKAADCPVVVDLQHIEHMDCLKQ
jgi:hypothetical protein